MIFQARYISVGFVRKGPVGMLAGAGRWPCCSYRSPRFFVDASFRVELQKHVAIRRLAAVEGVSRGTRTDAQQRCDPARDLRMRPKAFPEGRLVRGTLLERRAGVVYLPLGCQRLSNPASRVYLGYRHPETCSVLLLFLCCRVQIMARKQSLNNTHTTQMMSLVGSVRGGV